jgi:hypothetical protein
MSSIRRFVYATVLVITTLNFAPSTAFGQEPARGHFTLTHDVRWGNAKVPAGEYRFSFDPEGISGVLMLSKVDGTRKGYLLVVHDTEETKPSDRSRLVLNTTHNGSYVSAMQLPEFGMTLHFAVPPPTSEKQIARAATTAKASGQ